MRQLTIFEALWYCGFQFYSGLSIALALPIQIVSHVYEPFSHGVVLPFPIVGLTNVAAVSQKVAMCRSYFKWKNTALILTTEIRYCF